VEIAYTQQAKADIQYWKDLNKVSILNKITKLIQSIEVSPFSGIGKPELLKYKGNGLWSRRINKEHRIIYQVFDAYVLVLSLRGHYQ